MAGGGNFAGSWRIRSGSDMAHQTAPRAAMAQENGLKVSGVAHAYSYDRKTLAELLMATAEPVLPSEFVACLAMTGFRSLQTAYLQNTTYESWVHFKVAFCQHLLAQFPGFFESGRKHSSPHSSCPLIHHIISNDPRPHNPVTCSPEQGVLATKGLGSRSKRSSDSA